MKSALIAAVAALLLGCHGSPTEPRAMILSDGQWTGENVCLQVRNGISPPHTCTLRAGCGHGEFPTPQIGPDGAFEVDGTFRVEAGPVSVDPPPPAHYSGSLIRGTLTLSVRPDRGSTTTYRLHYDPRGFCGPACL